MFVVSSGEDLAVMMTVAPPSSEAIGDCLTRALRTAGYQNSITDEFIRDKLDFR